MANLLKKVINIFKASTPPRIIRLTELRVSGNRFFLENWNEGEFLNFMERNLMGPTQRIYMYTERTVPPIVFTKSVFCLRKPEAVRKTTPELLLAEW